jgi:hypothetical protein
MPSSAICARSLSHAAQPTGVPARAGFSWCRWPRHQPAGAYPSARWYHWLGQVPAPPVSNAPMLEGKAAAPRRNQRRDYLSSGRSATLAPRRLSRIETDTRTVGRSERSYQASTLTVSVYGPKLNVSVPTGSDRNPENESPAAIVTVPALGPDPVTTEVWVGL